MIIKKKLAADLSKLIENIVLKYESTGIFNYVECILASLEGIQKLLEHEPIETEKILKDIAGLGYMTLDNYDFSISESGNQIFRMGSRIRNYLKIRKYIKI